MCLPRFSLRALASLLAGLVATTAHAQSLGIFSWQLQPFCNRVTVHVVQTGLVYTLDGWDDQCGGAMPRAPLAGTATVNPDGTIGLGLNIVTAPGGVPVHVDARVTLPSASGDWRDSAGNHGTFALDAATPGLSPRPPGGIGAAAINPAQVQTRVNGVCPTGQLIQSINGMAQSIAPQWAAQGISPG